jgi:intraflagellar transport protein 43
VNRVDTYKELDSDLFKHATFATLDDVSLRLLTKCLNLESEIEEVGVIIKLEWHLLVNFTVNTLSVLSVLHLCLHVRV